MKSLSLLFSILIVFINCLQYEEIDDKEGDFLDSLDEKLGSGECSPTESEVKQMIKDNNINYNGDIDRNVKFIAGTCSPIVLVPGIYSTKLKVKLNCKNIKRDEESLYQKIKFYCSKYVCSDISDDNENRELWFNLGEKGFTLVEHIFDNNEATEEKMNEKMKDKNSLLYWEWDNRYAGCLGFFMTMFDNEEECPTLKNGKKVCGHSHNIKITYDGGFQESKSQADCGVKAVENVLTSPLQNFPEKFWKESSNVFGDLADALVERGYTKGFSLAAIPNDFRRFISTNDFGYESLKYHVENMYNITGKKVIIIAHSFGNLVTLNGLTMFPELKDKVKKWISLAPPFAGATKAVDNFLKGIDDFNVDILPLISKVNFHKFGQFLMLKSIPTVYELLPYTVFYKLFQSEDYKEFAYAIRERITLEKNCKNTQCSKDKIQQDSTYFDQIYSDYFPSLTLDACQFEQSVGGNSNTNNKKCMTELFNIVDYPSIIKVKNANNENNLTETTYDIEDYYQKKGDDLYYIADEGDIESNYIYKLLKEVPFVYTKYNKELEDMISRYNYNYNKNIKKTDPMFDTYDEIKETIDKMVEHLKKNSLIKDLPIPPVDIDLVYSSFNPTLAAQFIGEDLSVKESSTVNRGGDGTVPTWSSLLTGLKWIYEKQKNQKTQEIRLIEYCSRLANSDPNLKYFKPISCRCINNNVYVTDVNRCSHQFMLSDENLFNYLFEETNKDTLTIAEKAEAIETYSTTIDYLSKCNFKLFQLSLLDNTIQCKNDIIISSKEFNDNFCAEQQYSTIKGRECCSVHIHGINEKSEEFDEYYCENLKVKNIGNYKSETKEVKEFFESVEVKSIEVKCVGISKYLMLNNYYLLLIILLLFL